MIPLLLALTLQDDLIEQLGSDDLDEREKASRELEKLGEKAVPALVKALDHSDPEVKSRAEAILLRMSFGLSKEVLDRHPVVRDMKTRREILELLDELDRENLRDLDHFEHPADGLKRLPKYGRWVEIGKPAVPALVRAAASSDRKPEVRYFLVLLLGEMRDGLDTLLGLLESEVSFDYSAG